MLSVIFEALHIAGTSRHTEISIFLKKKKKKKGASKGFGALAEIDHFSRGRRSQEEARNRNKKSRRSMLEEGLWARGPPMRCKSEQVRSPTRAGLRTDVPHAGAKFITLRYGVNGKARTGGWR